MKTTKNIKSKVMKAAWTIYRKYKAQNMTNWSKALKRAWKWAKEKFEEAHFKVWSPKEGFFRLYIGENYIQITVKDRNPKGYYENHRACKGETFKTGYYKLVGITEELFNELYHEIRMIVWADLVPSKF
jgi:hypothetical protein